MNPYTLADSVERRNLPQDRRLNSDLLVDQVSGNVKGEIVENIPV
jgi:hypothetical protein